MTPTKTVIVHIGAHKTGTTYLQTSLILNRATFARQGVDTLSDLAVWGQGHHNIALTYLDWALRDEPRTREQYRKAIRARIHDSALPVVVVSSEFLELCDSRAIGRFVTDLGDCRTVLVYLVRNQPQYLESFYLEHFKQGLTESFASWVQGRVASGLGDFHGITRRWTDGLHPSATRIIIYENLQLAGINVFEYFAREILRIAEAQPLEFPSETIVNRTIDRRLRWLLREMNLRYGKVESHVTGISAQYLQSRQRLEQAYYGHPSLARGVERAVAIDAPTARLVEAYFESCNERFLRDFGPDICNPTAGGRLFPALRLDGIEEDADIGPERAELLGLLELVCQSDSRNLSARCQADGVDDFDHSRNLVN